MFNNKKMVYPDADKSLYYTKLAGEYGMARALFNLGAHYHRGEALEKDLEKALALYEQSADLEYVKAYGRLGLLYLNEDAFFDHFTHSIIQGNFSQQERKIFTQLVYKVASVEHVDFDFDLYREGIWQYENAERYGYPGEFKLTEYRQISDIKGLLTGKLIVLGIEYLPDHPGLSSAAELTYSLAYWEEFDEAGNKIDDFLHRTKYSGQKAWFSRYSLDKHKHGHSYRVTVYNLAGDVKFTRQFD